MILHITLKQKLTRARRRVGIRRGPEEALQARTQERRVTRALGVIRTRLTRLAGIRALVVARFTCYERDQNTGEQTTNEDKDSPLAKNAVSITGPFYFLPLCARSEGGTAEL